MARISAPGTLTVSVGPVFTLASDPEVERISASLAGLFKRGDGFRTVNAEMHVSGQREAMAQFLENLPGLCQAWDVEYATIGREPEALGA